MNDEYWEPQTWEEYTRYLDEKYPDLRRENPTARECGNLMKE